MINLDAACSVAESAARAAGEEIKKYIGKPLTTMEKSSPHDLVTEVDKRCQAIIESALLSAYPDSQVLGEEAVDPGSAAAIKAVEAAEQRFLWVVDPIDGTLNFIRGIPFCSVSIGLVYEGHAVLGVIYDPMRDEMFSGVTGGIATVNGLPVQVSDVPDVFSAVLASGFPTGDFRGKNAEQIRRFGHHARNVRAMGSAALHMAYVAAGRLDGFWENDLNAWDLLAGAVLVQVAGGVVTDADDRPYSLATRHVVATNGRIHARLISDLRIGV
jgi:myo-inositol-1(or 4)-monophosphatase